MDHLSLSLAAAKHNYYCIVVQSPVNKRFVGRVPLIFHSKILQTLERARTQFHTHIVYSINKNKTEWNIYTANLLRNQVCILARFSRVKFRKNYDANKPADSERDCTTFLFCVCLIRKMWKSFFGYSLSHLYLFLSVCVCLIFLFYFCSIFITKYVNWNVKPLAALLHSMGNKYAYR